MLTAKPLSWLNWDYEIAVNGRSATEMRQSGRSAEFLIDDRTYTLHNELLGEYTVSHDDCVIASAYSSGMLTGSFDISWGVEQFTLGREALVSRNFNVNRAGEIAGRIEKPSFFSWAEARLPFEFPLELKVCLFWIVVVQWRRSTR